MIGLNDNDDKVVLCAANSYKSGYYLNPDFDDLPEQVKIELKKICVGHCEEAGGIFILEFNKGELNIKVMNDDNDFYFDEIESGLYISKVQREKEELLNSLELFYKLKLSL